MTTYPLESVFVQARKPTEEKDFRRVLVLGPGALACTASERLAAEGFDTLWVSERAVSEVPSGVVCDAETKMRSVEGTAGDFQVCLETPGGLVNERVGHIVVADEGEWAPMFEEYGLRPAKSVISCADFEAALARDDAPLFAGERHLHVAALCGLSAEAQPEMFRRLLDALLRLPAIRRRTQAYVFTHNVKTAAAGVERLYRAAREAGALFFKFNGNPPTITQDNGEVRLVFEDPQLKIPLELAPDILVVEERPRVSEFLAPIRRAIPSSPLSAPFLSPPSPRFLGTLTPKAGIYALGAARGVFSSDQGPGDVDAVVLEIRRLTQCPVQVRDFGPPEVDQAKCTTCLTCVRLCPHGAMGFLKRAWADPASCMRCGICAAECPAGAITLPPLSEDAALALRVHEAARESRESGRTVAFLCEKSAAQALKRCDDSVRATLLPIITPCAGSVDVIHLLRAFESGARKVLVAACHQGACASMYGSNLAKERRAAAGDALEQAGIDSGRLLFITTAGNSHRDLAEIVSLFCESESNG